MSTELEIRHLREMIAALREELENARFTKGQHIEDAVATINEETRQLRASVVALREQMERREAEHQNEIQNLDQQHGRERAHLQKTINILREALEKLHESPEKTSHSAKAEAAARSR